MRQKHNVRLPETIRKLTDYDNCAFAVYALEPCTNR
jgi:hypothetical protein